MGCLPSINWCRILQPSTVTTYSNYKNSPFLSMDDSGKIYMTPWGFYRKRQGGPSKFTLQPSLRMIHDSPILTGDFPLLALNSTESFFLGSVYVTHSSHWWDHCSISEASSTIILVVFFGTSWKLSILPWDCPCDPFESCPLSFQTSSSPFPFCRLWIKQYCTLYINIMTRQICTKTLPKQSERGREITCSMIFGVLYKKNMFTDNDKHMQYILVGGLEHGFYFSIQLGIVTPTDFNSIIFQKGWLKPPTSNYY